MLWNPTALQTLASAGVTGPLGVEFTIPVYLDYFATFAWALSGAVVGVQHRYDIVGVFVIALVLSTGGGLLRDGFLLQRTPVFLSNGDYLVLITLATAVIAVATRWLMLAPKVPWSDKLIDFIDAFGVPAFAVIGMQLALDQGLPIPGVLLVGVINGVGGLLLRDLLANETPRLLLPGQYYALVLLIACLLFIMLTRGLGWEATPAAFVTVALFFVIRALTLRFNWQTYPLLRQPPK
jgi:uncharacterized membrane protein YeiH